MIERSYNTSNLAGKMNYVLKVLHIISTKSANFFSLFFLKIFTVHDFFCRIISFVTKNKDKLSINSEDVQKD